MKQTIKTSTYSFQGIELRCVSVNGTPWFVASDVLKVLSEKFDGSKGTAQWLKGLDYRDRKQVKDFGKIAGLSHQVVLLNESGLFTQILRAQRTRPQVAEFQRWVTSVVLPAIRETGGYLQGEERHAAGTMSDDELFALALVKAQATIAARDARIARQEGTINEQAETILKQAKVIREELEFVTVDEFRSLLHAYWTHATKVRIGTMASKICKSRRIEIKKQTRQLPTGRIVSVNVYPREVLEEARLLTM